MARYAQIETDFHKDLEFKHSDKEFQKDIRGFYLFYVISSENLIGLYRADPEVDRVSMGYKEQDFEKCRNYLHEKGKIIWWDNWIWIVGKAKKVQGEKQLASAYKILREVSDTNPLKQKLIEKYRYPIDRVSMGDTTLDTPIPIPKPIPILKDGGKPPNLPTSQEENISTFNEKEEVQKLVDYWNKCFPDHPVKGIHGVFYNMFRGEKGFDGGIEPEKIHNAIYNTWEDNQFHLKENKKSLDDVFSRMCSRLNKRHKYE